MRRLRRSLSSILTLSILPTSVLAQAGPDSVRVDSTRIDQRTYALEGVTVSVPRPGLTTGGASAVTVRVDSLSHVPAPTMEQVLRSMPLIQIRTNSRGQAQPALRGSGSRQIAILVDGVPLTLGWDHRSDLSIIPMTAARSVTLIRGLSSVLFGPNVLGGVVDVEVARSRRRVTRADPPTLTLSLDRTGATNLAATAGQLFDGGLSQWVFRGGVGFRDSPGAPVPASAAAHAGIRPALLENGDNLRLNSDARRIDGFLSLRYVADSGTWASLATSGFDTRRGVPPEAHVDNPRLWRYPSQRRFLAALSVGSGQRVTAWGEGDLEASLGVQLGSDRIDRYGSAAYETVVGGERGDDRTVTLRTLGEHSVGTRGEVRTSITYADVSHDERIDGQPSSSYRQRLWSLGAETEWSLGGRERTRATLGIAWDGADTPETGNKPPLDRLWDWGARFGTSTLLANGRVMLHGGMSRRARFPSLRELYSGALGRFVPNPGLRPEILRAAEAGLTVTGRYGEVQAVGFHHRLTDGIVRSSVTTPEGRKFRRVNQDEVRSTGVEFLAVGHLGRATLTGDLTLQSTHGFEPDGSRVNLEYEPAVAGRLSLETPFASGISGTGAFRFVGDQFCENPEAGGLQSFDSGKILDVGLRRVFSASGRRGFSRVDASVHALNVTDALAFDQCGLPQAGRTLRIQLRVR